jgi:hypothetical protein
MIRLRALENIEKNKLRVAKYYNKKVKVRQFAEGDLVWKALLPVGTKYSAFGKWSPNCCLRKEPPLEQKILNKGMANTKMYCP